MKRSHFIKTMGLGSLGVGLDHPLWSTTVKANSTKVVGQSYTIDELIGKNPRDLVGDTYLTTMQKDTALALGQMQAAALEDGIEIEVVSAYRSFDRQKSIFQRKYRRYTQEGTPAAAAVKRIIEYSTIPGTSRHHWGTDLDLIDGGVSKPESVLETRHYYGQGVFCDFNLWMQENADKFGFFQVYTNDPNRNGFAHEPWHYSFAPVSIPMLEAYRAIDLYELLINENLSGAQVLTPEFLADYKKYHILDINPLLLA
ncbi:MAG: D-alanyl-D-alanine carboxypeptidase family protein [Flavobacteriaceae bacterium]|nr:D-alanyl-D-alanine carboxypeptidase family protein [Flavobacteriaceae bacterium]